MTRNLLVVALCLVCGRVGCPLGACLPERGRRR